MHINEIKERMFAGWGNGLTGPNTPNILGVTVHESLTYNKYIRSEITYEEWCHHTPISFEKDTIAICVGPNHKENAEFIIKACKAYIETK